MHPTAAKGAAAGDALAVMREGRELVMKRSIPGPLWVSVVALCLLATSHIVPFVLRFSATYALAAAIHLIVLFGVCTGKKWAFILICLVSLFGFFGTLVDRPGDLPAYVLNTGLVLVPMVICRRFFFPENSNQGPPQESGHARA